MTYLKKIFATYYKEITPLRYKELLKKSTKKKKIPTSPEKNRQRSREYTENK